MKGKVIGKNVNKMMTRGNFLIKRIKRRENFIKPIIHVDDRSFDLQALVTSKHIQ